MATLKLKYDSASNKLQTTIGLWVDDVKLKLGFTDKALRGFHSAKEDLEVGVERPGHFMLEHHLHKKHTRFQFHSHAGIQDKTFRLTIVHHIMAHAVTTLEASATLDSHNKVIVKHNFSKPGPVVKYEFIREDFLIEPLFDFGAKSKAAWGIGLKLGHGKKDFVKASYQHHKKEAELELHKKMGSGGPLKVSATIDTDDIFKSPKFVVEKEWKL